MYVDLVLLFIIYAFSCIALGVSIYAVWTLNEIRDYYKRFYSNSKKTKVYTPAQAAPTKKLKSHWD